MALEALNRKSKIVVHNSATDLVDKTPLEGYQGSTVEDISFKKIADDNTLINPSFAISAAAQKLKIGETFVRIGEGNVACTEHICIGEYGKTIKNGLDLVTAANSTINYSGTVADSTINNVFLKGGSVLVESDEARADVTIASNQVTAIVIDKRGTNYKAGDVVTILGTDLGGASPADDITITLDQADLNYTALGSRTFTNV